MCDRAYLAREVEQALGYAKEALDLARARRHSPAYASALLWVAELDRLAGNLDAAERNHREVLCVAREAGRQPDIVVTLLNLSSIAIARGGAREVPAMLLEALEVVVRIASEPLGANVLLIASALAAHLKSWRLAAKLFGAGDAQCIRTGFRREPTDEAFIAPLVAKARHAVGNAVFGQAEAAGRLLDYDTALAEARRWLQSCATHPGGASNVVALPPR